MVRRFLRILAAAVGFSCPWVLMGFWIGGRLGAAVAFALSCLVMGFAWLASPFLLVRMTQAIRIKPEEAPEIYDILEKLSRRSSISFPQLYGIASASSNLFSAAGGWGKSCVVMTHGLVKLLNKEEIEGLLSFEIARMRKGETQLKSWIAVLAGVPVRVLDGIRGLFSLGEREQSSRDNGLVILLSWILLPFAAVLVQIGFAEEGGSIQAAADHLAPAAYRRSALRRLEFQHLSRPLHGACLEHSHLWILSTGVKSGLHKFFDPHSLNSMKFRLRAAGFLKSLRFVDEDRVSR